MNKSIIVLLAVCGSLCAQEIKLDKAVEWVNPYAPKTPVTVKNGTISVTSAELDSTKKILVDPEGLYKLRFTAQSLGKKPAWMMVGFSCYDKKDRAIQVVNVANKADSLTEIVENAPRGSKSFKVKSAAKFNKDLFAYFCLALDAKADFSDLPNYRIATMTVANLKQEKDYWVVNLKKPLTVDLRAGTKVRQHYPGGAFYAINCQVPVGKWQTFEGYNDGICKTGTAAHKFPTGTASVKVVFSNNGAVPAELKDVKVVLE